MAAASRDREGVVGGKYRHTIISASEADNSLAEAEVRGSGALLRRTWRCEAAGGAVGSFELGGEAVRAVHRGDVAGGEGGGVVVVEGGAHGITG